MSSPRVVNPRVGNPRVGVSASCPVTERTCASFCGLRPSAMKMENDNDNDMSATSEQMGQTGRSRTHSVTVRIIRILFLTVKYV